MKSCNDWLHWSLHMKYETKNNTCKTSLESIKINEPRWKRVIYYIQTTMKEALVHKTLRRVVETTNIQIYQKSEILQKLILKTDSLEIDIEAKHLQLSLARFILNHAHIENKVTSEVKLPAWKKFYMVAKPTKTLKSKNEDLGNP